MDSSIWVGALLPNEKMHAKAQTFLTDTLSGKHNVVSPYSVLVESVCALSRGLKAMKFDRKGALNFHDVLKRCPYIAWKNVDRLFAEEALLIGWYYGLRGMDALVAATALYYGIPILTEDKEFKRIGQITTVLSLRDI